MSSEKMEMLKTYISANVAPILVEGIPASSLENAIVIPSNCDDDLLNGHYEEEKFLPPKWYEEVQQKANDKINILIIDNITKISKDEQMKFYELLKYRKVGVFELPQNCIIIVIAEKVNPETISSEIYSLVAHV